MDDPYLKKLKAERSMLWTTCRRKGLREDSPERQRIAEINRLIDEYKAKQSG